MPGRQVALSVVSHAQNALVLELVADLERHCQGQVELLITENVPDPVPIALPTTRNAVRKGFGANHNAAFARARAPFFCVCNPDIRLCGNPFPGLLEALQDPSVGVVGPLVRSPDGGIEDSARRFPTVRSLARRILTRQYRPDYPPDRGTTDVDWVAGMFMLFRSQDYRDVRGFDERYFLYYEDVDLCRRMHAAGKRVLYQPRSEVVHHARRGSHRNAALALQHAKSGLRFFLSR